MTDKLLSMINIKGGATLIMKGHEHARLRIFADRVVSAQETFEF